MPAASSTWKESMNRQSHAGFMTYVRILLGCCPECIQDASGCQSVPNTSSLLTGCDDHAVRQQLHAAHRGVGLTIFSPRLTAMLRPGKAMMSILFISMRAKSTVGTSSNEMVTAPRHGIVSTKGFSVIRAQALSCRCRKARHKLMYHLRISTFASGLLTFTSELHNC